MIVKTNLLPGPVEQQRRSSFQTTPFDELNFHSDYVDWTSLRAELGTVDWTNELAGLSVDAKYKSFVETVFKISQKYVPKRSCFTKKKIIPRDRRRLMAQRKRLNRKMLGCRNNRNLAEMELKMTRIENKIKSSHDAERMANEFRAVQAIKKNPKYFFKFAQNKSAIRTRIGPLEGKDGTPVQHPKQMSALLSEQYQAVFSEPDPDCLVEDPDQFFCEKDLDGPVLEDLELGRYDFVHAANRLRPTSAAGPDGFPAVLLKQCAWELSSPLVVLWQASLREGVIPEELKKARITPIFKGGRRSSPASYRPVALTSHVVKIFERILTEKIVDYLENNAMLNQRQHGFRRGRSCLSQLLDHHDRILDALTEGAGVDAIYLDLWKAFDQVDHGLLLHKARRLGITGKIGAWLHAFLTARKQAVVVEGCCSDESSVLSGVPQGSVLGPVLFLLLLGDIDAGITHSMASSFADDTRVVGRITGTNSVSAVQRDLENIYGWADANNMRFNSEKFQLLRYGKNATQRPNVNYVSYDATEIEECDSVKDLGVLVQSDGMFTNHIVEVVNGARSQMGWILRSFATRSVQVMLTLYKTLVLPRLEYCSPLWSPSRIGEIESLEGVQRTFTSRIPAVAHLDYWERIAELGLYSVERRRERYSLLYLHKIMYGLVPDVNGKIKTIRRGRRGLICEIERVNFRAPAMALKAKTESFAYRAPQLFNSLPRYLREVEGLDKFKRALDKFLRNVPDQPHAHGYHRRAASNSIRDQLDVMRRDGRCLDRPQGH